jgi:hypothetical protein
MKDYVDKALGDLDEQLNFIHLETDEPLRRAELSITVIHTSLENLKKQIVKQKLRTEQEEINFFKKLKPKFLSKLIYHVKIYNIEMHKPNGSDKAKKKYLQNELHNIEQFFNRNLDFIKYYRTQKSYLDYKYFVRGKHDLSLSLDTFYFETDKNFSTSHDFKVSEIMANELLEIYLKAEIEDINKQEKTTTKGLISPKVKLTWTASKASLIELIYALQSQGAFNNTTASIKDIVNYFESVFNIDLNHFYTTFQVIKERKGHQTMFLKALQENLQKRINEKEDRS